MCICACMYMYIFKWLDIDMIIPYLCVYVLKCQNSFVYMCMNVVIPSLTLLFDHAIVTFKHCFMFHPSSPLPPM